MISISLVIAKTSLRGISFRPRDRPPPRRLSDGVRIVAGGAGRVKELFVDLLQILISKFVHNIHKRCGSRGLRKTPVRLLQTAVPRVVPSCWQKLHRTGETERKFMKNCRFPLTNRRGRFTITETETEAALTASAVGRDSVGKEAGENAAALCHPGGLFICKRVEHIV